MQGMVWRDSITALILKAWAVESAVGGNQLKMLLMKRFWISTHAIITDDCFHLIYLNCDVLVLVLQQIKTADPRIKRMLLSITTHVSATRALIGNSRCKLGLHSCSTNYYYRINLYHKIKRKQHRYSLKITGKEAWKAKTTSITGVIRTFRQK